MKYKLVESSVNDIQKLIEYKKRNIFDYASDISSDEIDEINDYVIKSVKAFLDSYYNIVVNKKIVGCLLVTKIADGKLLDEIYLEEKYRGSGIGTDIIKNIIKNNSVLYLWVYKNNERAFSLYKKLGFYIILETDSRYYMKYSADK